MVVDAVAIEGLVDLLVRRTSDVRLSSRWVREATPSIACGFGLSCQEFLPDAAGGVACN
jgi:hypothetical protein